MKNLIIVGAGGFGREMYGSAMNSLGYMEQSPVLDGLIWNFSIKGFLDARPDALEGFNGYPPVIGSPDTYVPEPDDVFITALGSIEARRRCVAALESHGAHFMPIIDRTAFVGPNTEIGAGAFIARNVSLTADVRIGRHACVFHNSTIGHDSSLGDFSHVYGHCAICGAVKIGNGAAVYPGTRIVPGRTVGDGAVVGIGSVVLLNVKPGATVFGNPAAPVEHAFCADT